MSNWRDSSAALRDTKVTGAFNRSELAIAHGRSADLLRSFWAPPKTVQPRARPVHSVEYPHRRDLVRDDQRRSRPAAAAGGARTRRSAAAAHDDPARSHQQAHRSGFPPTARHAAAQSEEGGGEES